MKQQMDTSGPIPFYKRALVAGFAGACGGFVGTPGDMINVRMQNDIKLPADQKRKYEKEHNTTVYNSVAVGYSLLTVLYKKNYRKCLL